MSSIYKLLFAAILLTYGAAGTLFATLTPKWQAPDEPAHYNYIHYLATQPGFPELTPICYNQQYLTQLTSRRFPPELSIDNVCYEFHQPPLYYILAVPVFTTSDGWWVALRLVSVVLGAGVLVLAYTVAKSIFPNQPAVALGTMAFVAFVPMHVAILSSINNDALAELVLAVLLWLMTRRIMLEKGEASTRENLLLGLILGVGLVTKTTVYIAIPLIAAALWLAKTTWPKLIKQAALIYGVALIIALPWYFRNAVLYGNFDILGLGRHNEVVVGQLRTTDVLSQVGAVTFAGNFIATTFRSFWGQFGWMAVPMDSRTYLFLTALTLSALTGVLLFLFAGSNSSNLTLPQKRSLILMALTILLMMIAYSGYNLTFVQFQGRYLFPSLIPLGMFFSLGLTEILRRRWAWALAVGLGVILVGVAVSTGLSGGLDKWAILLLVLALGLIISHRLLPEHQFRLTYWLVILCYVGLALLALVSPYWFIIPNL